MALLGERQRNKVEKNNGTQNRTRNIFLNIKFTCAHHCLGYTQQAATEAAAATSTRRRHSQHTSIFRTRSQLVCHAIVHSFTLVCAGMKLLRLIMIIL